MLRPPASQFFKPPAKAEIGRVKIQPRTDKNPGKEQVLFLDAGILQSLVGHLEHQELTGQHLLNLFRRDAKDSGSGLRLRNVKAFEVGFFIPFILKPAALFRPPPVRGQLWFDDFFIT